MKKASAPKPRGKRRLRAQRREHVAHHEAGHYVAAYFDAMHDSIFRVTIAPSSGVAGRNTGEHPLGEEWSAREAHQVVVGLYAGYAAEVRFDPSREREARLCASSDDEIADALLRSICKARTERWEWEQLSRSRAAAVIVEHWHAVTALARELLDRTTLEGDEAAWIVAIAEGKRAKRNLDEYRRRRAVALGPLRVGPRT
jgi:ATP-dependent Zn protease